MEKVWEKAEHRGVCELCLVAYNFYLKIFNYRLDVCKTLPLHLHLIFQQILSCQSRQLSEEGGEVRREGFRVEHFVMDPLNFQNSAPLPSSCAALGKSLRLVEFQFTPLWNKDDGTSPVCRADTMSRGLCTVPGAKLMLSKWHFLQSSNPYPLDAWGSGSPNLSLELHRSNPINWFEQTGVERMKPLLGFYLFLMMLALMQLWFPLHFLH